MKKEITNFLIKIGMVVVFTIVFGLLSQFTGYKNTVLAVLAVIVMQNIIIESRIKKGNLKTPTDKP